MIEKQKGYWEIWSVETANLIDYYDDEETYLNDLKWYQEEWGEENIAGIYFPYEEKECGC